MWHEKEKNCRLSDQRTTPNKSFGDYTCSKVLPPSGNYVDSFNGFSGKRKVAAIDLTHKYIKEFRSPVGVNEQESKNGLHAKKSFGEQATSNQQFTNYETNCGNEDSQMNATDNLNDAPSSVPDDSLCHEGPSSTMIPVGESVLLLTQQASACQNEVQVRRSMLGFLSGKTYESDEQNHVRSQQKAASPEIKISNNTSVDDMLSSNGSRLDKLVEDCQKIVQHGGPSIADENILLSSGKPLITVNDKLWDGRVQLSSSVTVSAVAFFKSGEKLPDTSWSGFIEVKGKVRLEAFEKYVQDLPRSRNRGLMVISLCSKDGSSETDFAGMKEVSNGYKKGSKVGYAQLSAGTDIYICPHSSTIITILSKYGFFKGMSATEDKQESLIGCVVWRKSQVCLNPVTKTLDSRCKSSSEQPIASVSGSLSNQVAGKKSYPTQPGQQTKSTQHVPAVSTPSLERAGGIGNEIKKIESSDGHHEIKKSSPADTVPATPSNISVTHVPQKMSAPSLGPSQASSGTLFEVQGSLNVISGVEHSKVNWQEKNALVSVQYNVKKSCSPTFDGDDLPEYDFGTARGISSTALSRGVGASMLDMNLLATGNSKQIGLVSSTMGTVHTISAPNQSLDNIPFPTYHSAPYQEKASAEVVCERVCENSRNHHWEEQCSVQGKAIPMPPTAAFISTEGSCTLLSKNKFLYDDDDDMPEWCPPEPYKQSLGEANRPSTAIPQKLHDSSFTNISSDIPQPVILPPPPPRPVVLPPPPPRPIILPPPPPPPSIHSQFSYQQLHPAVQVPITFSSNSPRPVAIQSSSTVSSGFNSDSALRPQSSSLDIRPPYQFSGRVDWKPRR